jgi:hypothetical protein
MECRWNHDRGMLQLLGEKRVPLPLCSPQIPRVLAWDRTCASAVRGRRLTVKAINLLVSEEPEEGSMSLRNVGSNTGLHDVT